LTQNQMHELLESEHARTFVEGAEERGFVEPAEIEAFALEHDLGEEDAEQFQRELEAIGLEIRQPVEEAEPKAEKPEEKPVEAQPQVLVGSADPLGGAHTLRVVAQQLEVDHLYRLLSRANPVASLPWCSDRRPTDQDAARPCAGA